MEKKWELLSPDEKQEARFQKVLAPKDPAGNDLAFQSQKAKADYTANILRIKDAVQMKKKPDRVPVAICPSMFPFINAGMTIHEAMYDYDKCIAAFKTFVVEFQPDIHMGAAAPGPGKFFEILDYKLYSWPGHGVAAEYCYQCNEGEYMKAEEYDLLITDPSFFFRNFYLPRVFGSLGGLAMLPPLTGILEMYGLAFNFIPFALPPVQNAFKSLFEAGAEALKWAMAIGASNGELASLGFPNIFGGYTKAPFDMLGDTLRGTKSIMLDIHRRPDKLHKALEAMTPIMTAMGIQSAQQTGNPVVFIPLHKGADGFLSDSHFRGFFWQYLKQVILGLIAEGCIPFVAIEGAWGSRLDVIKDIPQGKSIWMIDQTDMVKAKETLGKNACLFGNVSSSLLRLGKPDEIKAYAKKLIDVAGKDGGFIMGNGAFFDEADPANIKTLVTYTKEHGVYK